MTGVQTCALPIWMDRDFLFSKEIERQCNDENFKVIVNDGTVDLDNMVNGVVAHFEID